MRAELVICSTCDPDASHAPLEDALREADLPVRLARQACLNACGAPVAVALQGEGLATYVFGAVDPASDAGDIVATVRAWLNAPEGWIEDARACGRLRHCLRARVRAMGSR